MAASFKMVFDPTLVRGMSYYTGTIFEIAMPELGAACGGGGRYDKMIGKFTGNDVPACGFSIGFERIILLLMESGFKIPERPKRVAYLVEKKYPAEKLVDVMKQAKEAGCEKVYNGMSMMLFQALIAIKLYTGKDTPVDYMKEKLGI